ncbi:MULTISPECIES: DUF4123 domain-containing protein [unclassified Modicisalibacter]|uniref:DUF4123 domain-containing protein n=1 Tax=unclassified Modicisalibacter TaxID=2679913 RepID=UPI001CCE446D|nr:MULTISPECIES: DUF4123 domain-containing protein [unclassified Modicisalibacter]MBZ9556825.1 DUF4123 domain-containing protein [Modicisalibacter sp. R2A 31.J]MBZ9574704.1 DUF4123 domain-containing protein [Modicisalibacter sp. MOD 31.J]
MDPAFDEAAITARMVTAANEGHLLRLVDPANAPARQCREDTTLRRIDNPFVVLPETQHLYLERIATGDAEALHDEIQRERQGQPISRVEPVAFCGWLISRQALSTIAGYLRRQLAQKTPEGKNALLRFYDPRVMERLTRILDQAQLSTLLGPIDQWIHFDNGRALRWIAPHQGHRRLAQLKLNADQWQSIRRIGQVNRCLELYRTLPDADHNREMGPDDTDRLIVEAHGYGLSERQDISAFVLHGLLLHERFHRHPLMQTLLKKRASGMSYIGLTNRLTQQDWEAIAEDKETFEHDGHVEE